MMGREISDLERDVLSLPIRLGGLCIGKLIAMNGKSDRPIHSRYHFAFADGHLN